MIEFITLFLGALATGPMQVELMVDREVATVEILLDAESVAQLYAEPWQVEVDFGEELAPHLLEAVAHAADGKELGRARQWVNLSPRQTELSVVIEHDQTAARSRARLSWQSLSAESSPVGVSAVFDGKPLAVEDPHTIPLPPHNPNELHILRVELLFSNSSRSMAEIAFGGGAGYRDEVSTELTAFALALDDLTELPSLDAMQDWFLAAGETLPVQAVETGLADIVVVRDRATRPFLDDIAARQRRTRARPILRKDHRLRFFGVQPAQVEGDDSDFMVFPRSREVQNRVGGLARALSAVQLPHDPSQEQRLADAVAVAGLFASQSGRRRVVIVVTTDDPADGSQFSPAEVSRYLQRLGVPLVVWNPRKGATSARDWGSAFNVSTESRLSHAYNQLSRLLHRQRIVWLSGLHLPQAIDLGPEARGVLPAR
jgi:hypothetical protein